MGNEIELLADRYLKNKCTPGEAQLVLYWFSTEPGRKYLQKQLDKDTQLLENDNLFISPVNVPSSKMFDAILTGIKNIHEGDVEKRIEAAAPTPKHVMMFRQLYLGAAIATAIFFGLFIAYISLAGHTVTRATRYGETARIILPDSSLVTLNGNSRIEYVDNWKSDETRKVKLDGEAYFSVKHKTNLQKFIVSLASNIQIEVLGTEFNISDRKRETQIVLVSGKIRLDMQSNRLNRSLTMKPGESVEISSDKGLFHKNKVDLDVITSWKDNKLVFNNTSVREICDRLKDIYGYRITVSDPRIMNQRITGSVPNQSIEMVLEGLEVILGVKFKKSSD